MRALPFLALLLAGCPTKGDPAESLERVDLGSFTTDTGFGADVPVEVPEDAVSSLVYCGPYGYDTLATAEKVTAPDGSVVFDLTDPEATPFRIGVQDDFLPMLLPVSPDLPLVPGAYTWRVYVDSAAPVTISCGVMFRTSEPAAAQKVDVHLIFVGVEAESGLNATAADENAVLTAALERVDQLWSAAGLSIGTVTYEDFGGDVDTYNSVDGDREFGDLLRTANNDDAPVIPVFLVSAITDDDGATILGLAAGPPGAAATGGNSKGGAVVTVGSVVDGDSDTFARILAHELLHFMGLFHPIAKDGSETDPIGDTPSCTNDADGNGTYSSEECAGAGAENLMWWAASSSATDLTADQAWVVNRSGLAY